MDEGGKWERKGGGRRNWMMGNKERKEENRGRTKMKMGGNGRGKEDYEGDKGGKRRGEEG